MVDSEGHRMWRFNATSGIWEKMNRTPLLMPLDAFWIYSSGTVEIPLSFDKSQTHLEKTLYSGWNGFRIPGTTDRQAREAIAPISRSWTHIIGFNPFTQLYDPSIINGGSGEHSDVRPMYPKLGYWLLLIENTTYRVDGVIIP